MPDSSTQNNQLLNENEIARQFGLPEKRLQALRCRGGGPKFIKVGRSVRYRAADVEAWLEANTKTSTSESQPGARH